LNSLNYPAIREKVLTEHAEPICAQLKIDIDLSSLVVLRSFPKIDREDPIRKYVLSDMELPSVTKLQIDAALLSLAH
jgi:hypothetical protein